MQSAECKMRNLRAFCTFYKGIYEEIYLDDYAFPPSVRVRVRGGDTGDGGRNGGFPGGGDKRCGNGSGDGSGRNGGFGGTVPVYICGRLYLWQQSCQLLRRLRLYQDGGRGLRLSLPECAGLFYGGRMHADQSGRAAVRRGKSRSEEAYLPRADSVRQYSHGKFRGSGDNSQ